MRNLLCCLGLLFALPSFASSIEEGLCHVRPRPVDMMAESEKLCIAFVRSLGKLPGEAMTELEAMLSPESLATMGTVTAAWLGTQGIPVVGQTVDAALLVLGIAMAAAQTATVKDSLWNYVKYATEATDEEGLNQAATHLARGIALVGVSVVTFILMKKVPSKQGARPGPREPPPTMLPALVGVGGGAPATSPAMVVPAVGSAPALAITGGRATGGRVPPKKMKSKAVDAKAFREWIDKAQRRPARDSPEAYAYQKKHAGKEEILVSGGGAQVWADGARPEAARLLEVKHVGQPDKSPFIAGSQCEEWLRLKIERDITGEFRRYAAVINDPSTPATSIEVIVNDARAVPYFEKLLRKFGIPGEVVVRP